MNARHKMLESACYTNKMPGEPSIAQLQRNSPE